MRAARFTFILHILLAALPVGGVSQWQGATTYLIDHFEGGAAIVVNDAGKGVTRYGINQAAHPEIADIAGLTRAEAERIYKRDYWDKLHIGALPPEMRFLAFDCAVNVGVARTRKWLAEAQGDAATLWRLRTDWHRRLVAGNPALYGPYALTWRLRDFVVAYAASLPLDIEG